MIIARTWHGCVPLKHADGFSNHLDVTGIKHSKGIKGNLGAFIRREKQNEMEHFFLITYWASFDSIKAFAGDDYEVAVTYQDDEVFELISDPFVFHHEVNSIKEI